jgi:hypothetical protein
MSPGADGGDGPLPDWIGTLADRFSPGHFVIVRWKQALAAELAPNAPGL